MPLPPISEMRPPRTGKRKSRRQRVPPALTRGPDRLDGLGILDEVGGELGLVLWRSARNVRLWAETPAERRGGLFSGGAAQVRRDELAGAGPDPELLAPLSVIVSLLERPATADVLRVVNACRRVALWAEQRGALATALEFAQAAALVVPDSAALAYAVGRLARRHSEFDRAESWYTRAIIQGRQTKDWRAYAQGFTGMGNLHMQRGNYPAARRSHVRALRAAGRHGHPELLGMAYHDLFVVTAAMGGGFEADHFAAKAFRAYGAGHPGVLRLAYDVAYHWTLQGYFSGALGVATSLVPHVEDLAMRALLQALVARAAGGAGDPRAFETAAADAQVLIEQGVAQEMTAPTLLGLTYGAMSLGEWERACEWAERALWLATEHREGRVALEAEAALDSAKRRVGRLAPAQPIGSRPAPELDAAAELADQFVEALAARQPAAVG